MKFFVVCLFAGIFVVAYNHASAQTKNATIQGKVTTGKNITADFASVILLTAVDSAVLKSTPCDSTGFFKFDNIEPGKYLIIASKIGFNQLLSGPYIVAGSGTIKVSVTLAKSYPILKEVTVSSQKPYIEVRPGKVVLNVQSSPIAQGNSVFDILRQAPGVRIDNNGNISIIGHQNALIMIDGKPTTLTGESLAEFIQAQQSSNVQQIELITSPSAKYDAAGAGIINIISKKGTNVGTNGNVTLGAGYGAYYKATGGFVFNHRSDKFNIFGNYSFTPDKTFHSFLTDRIINYQGLNSDYNTNYFTSQQRYNQNFKVGADYYITDKQTLGILFYGTISDNTYDKRNMLNIANNGIHDSTITTKSNLKREVNNLNYDINYSGVLDDAGKMLSADFVYNNYDRRSDEYITNDFYNAAGAVYRQPLLQQNLSPSNIDNYIVKVDFTNPLSKKAKLEAGFKYSYVKSNNVLVFGPQVNGVYTSDPNFSNTFLYTENVNSGYVNYTAMLGKVNIVAGLRAEQTNSTGTSVTLMQTTNKSYLDFFPQVQLVYQYDAKNEFTLSYNRGIQRPSYAVINPFLYYTDLYDYKSGNPNLLPEYSNKIELSHEYDKTFTTTIYAHFTSGFYDFTDDIQNDMTKVNITTNNNFGTYSSYGLRFNAPAQFTNWWNLNFSIDAAYQRIKSYPVYGNLNKGTQDIEPSLNQRFTLGNTTVFEISAKYNSATFYGIDQFKANYLVGAGISKQLFNKRATLSLNMSDIFNSIYEQAHSTYQNLNLSIVDKVEPRIMKLNFIYRFGKSTVKAIRHQAANEDEQKRTTTTN